MPRRARQEIAEQLRVEVDRAAVLRDLVGEPETRLKPGVPGDPGKLAETRAAIGSVFTVARMTPIDEVVRGAFEPSLDPADECPCLGCTRVA